jgi:DNA-directed RNA polymerase subunit L
MYYHKSEMFRNYSYDPKDPSDKHSFELHDIDVAVINGIRRTILTDIPMPGIIGAEDGTVKIIKNIGPLHNEIISHRIGLLPICLSEDDIEDYDDSIELELNVINEGNAMKNVTTADIKAKKHNKELTKKELEKMFPPNPVTKSHILITRLRTNEQLHFKATVVKRTARFDAGFSPVSLSNFFYIQDPALAKKKDSILDKERAYYTNKYGDANAVQFEIEPINKLLGPRYLVNKAFEIIIEKLNKLITNIISEGLGSNGVSIYQFQDLQSTYEFLIENEDDTLGNIIQSHVHTKYVREEKPTLDGIHCSYIGYICPHPLKTDLLIRITLDDQVNPKTFVKFMEANCRAIIDELNNMKKEWNNFTKNIKIA